jgi:predicted MFS family arabinose efflux permease
MPQDDPADRQSEARNAFSRPERVQPSLWHHPDFARLWAGETISQFGSTISREALPLTALLVLGATPLQMGVLAAGAGLPVLAIGLVAGVWVDRLRRRPIMLWTDVGRAVLLACIPAAAALGVLRFEHLLIVALLVGTLTVFFDAAYQAFVPVLVSRGRLVEANSKIETGVALSEITAPGVAGVLVQTISGPMAVLLDALTFAWSALMLLFIRTPEPPPPPVVERQHLLSEVVEGVRLVAGHPVLRALGGAAATGAFFGNFFAALYSLYAVRELGLGPALLGVTIACGGAGSLVGAAVAGRIVSARGVGPTIVGAALVNGGAALLIPLAGGPVLLAALVLMVAQFVGDGAATTGQIAATSVRQAAVSDRLLGRASACMYLLRSGMAPLGALVGGLLAEMIGIRPTVAIAVAGGLLRLVWLVCSPLPKLRGTPDLQAQAAQLAQNIGGDPA